MKLLKKIFATIFALTIVFAPMALHLVHAADYGLDKTADAAGVKPTGTPIGPATLIGKLIGYGLAFIGVIFFALMVYGGFLWMTARGTPDQAKKALTLIEQAVIGIIIVFLSYVITNFILTKLLPGLSSQ